MMDELKQQFYEVMHKYQKPFSEEGVTANLTQWYEQKQGLLQLLRKHPLWNEKELAIVFRVEERREIDRTTVDETRAAILELGRRACTDDTVYENFETALRAATADYARIPNEYRLDTIRQYGGIKCAPGQKSSRIINRLCLKFHLDQIEEETEAGEPDNRYMRTVRPYNALFARLADALNPAHIEKTAVLSIHPCDFLEMSNRDNTWSSCHCLERGSYHGGCQSYMSDAVSMIFFTVSDEYTQDFHTAPRITREIFCYKDNVLLQSRLYPTDLEDQKTLYRSIVQQAIATCLDKPNLWSIKRGKDTEPYCESAADSNHYPDYEYGYAVVSLLKGESDYGKMTIGSVARCVCCGGEQKNHRSIRCAECGNMYVCKGCGKTVHVMLIAIDHGNKQVKTVHGNAIVSGVQKSKTRPYGRDVLKYGGSYYTLSAQRIPYQKDKTTDERFFILSLFAIAEEIEAQGAYTSGLMPIDLAIGLPPAHFGAQNKAFVRYFKRKEPIYFSYRDKLYSILIRNVQCYPQAFAAAAMMLGELATVPRALILDVGGFTADYLLLKNGRADLSTCDSLENGVILLYNRIRSKASSDLDILLEETDVDAILLQGQGSSYGEEAATLVEYQAQEFVNDMLGALRERQLDLRTGRVIFVGGGACLLRRQIETSGKVAHPVFVENVNANAKGFEYLYRCTVTGV